MDEKLKEEIEQLKMRVSKLEKKENYRKVKSIIGIILSVIMFACIILVFIFYLKNISNLISQI